MTFPKGQWTTEYAVAVPRDIGHSYHNHDETRDEVLGDLAEWQSMGYPDAHIVSRQVFHGEWQPLPESEQTP